jgi:alanine-glyoxylate transaminase / serine-glyoxylate transaminase / serine-pyruvate transaminase
MDKLYAPLEPPVRHLFGPGPSPVSPRVYQAMAKPIVGHLDPYFFQVVGEIKELLNHALGTSNEFTLAISGTGSAGMEAAIGNFAGPGTKVAIFSNGYFALRMADMTRRQGAEVVSLDIPWGQVASDDQAREFIHKEKPQIVFYVQAETATGAYQRGKAIAQAAREVDALVIADCVTSLAGMPVEVDANLIDVAYSGTQKALACPPGLSPITLSPRALERLRARTRSIPSWYLDLKLLDEYLLSAHRYHHTAPITLFYALRESLVMIVEEGLENRWARHRRNHEAFVAGIEALGMSMQVAKPDRLWTLNTPCVPQGIDDAKLRGYLMNKHGIEIAGGLGELAGKVLRIGTMGYGSTRENILLMLRTLEEALREQGYQPKASGVEAAEAAYAGSQA